MHEVTMAGTTQKCLVDFSQRFPGPSARKLLADFATVKEPTVDTWIRGEREPGGAPMLYLRVFLEAVGYRVKEVRELPEDNQTLAKLIGFKVISPQEAMTALGYRDDYAIFRLTLRGATVMSSTALLLERLLNENSDRLEELVAEFDVVKTELFVGNSSANGVPPLLMREGTVGERTVEGLAYTLRSASSLASAIFSGEIEDPERSIAILHGHINPEEIAEILDGLDRLRVVKD